MKINNPFSGLLVGYEPVQAGITAAVNTSTGNKNRLIHMSTDNEGERRTVEAEHRRRPDSPSGGRERAEAPQRREDSGGRGDTGGGSGPTGGSGRSLPGGKGCLSGGSIIVIIIIVAIFFGVQNCGGPGAENETTTQPYNTTTTSISGFTTANPGYTTPAAGWTTGQMSGVSAAAPFATYLPSATTAAPAKSGQTWLVMLYQDADDQVLEKDICMDLNEAEKAGSSSRVKIVAQVDRYSRAYSGDGNWTSTRRFLISQDDNLGQVRSQQIADLGEVNMASGQTLIDFAVWAMTAYPADKYVLILSDHGMGWPGGWTDATPKGSVDNSIPLEARLGDMIYLNEMDEALGQIRGKTGLDKFEMIGLDACLMAQLEVFTALEPHARFAVASEEVEPSLGWAYSDFLEALNQNPDMSGAELSRLIVQGYIENDQSLQDSSARADFMSQGSPLGGLFGQPAGVSAQQMAREIGQTSTLSAVDLSRISVLNSSLNALAYVFQKADQKVLAGGRSYAQSYTSVFGSQVPASYIDLGNFLQIVKQKTNNTQVIQAADGVLTAIKQTVIAEKHGTQKPGSTGMAIYYPNSQLYQNPITGAKSYTAIASRFAARSLWDDFLAYHYTNQTFTESAAQAVVPSGAVRAPASGGISVSAVKTSSTEVAPGQKVTLSADINGNNIGHIYLFAGYYDRAGNSILVADQDYLESSQIRQVNGVYYPDWGQGSFSLKFNWEPVVFAINDGSKSVSALFKPEDFGRTAEEAIYTVDGTYTFASNGDKLTARLYFINGLMRQVFGFTGQSDASTPREITPGAGDKFTVRESWLDLNSSGQVSSPATKDGNTLTFGQKMFTWKTLDAAAGDYVVGFVVEDLDGNQQQALTGIKVK
jgi:hypothetical protein